MEIWENYTLLKKMSHDYSPLLALSSPHHIHPIKEVKKLYSLEGCKHPIISYFQGRSGMAPGSTVKILR